MAGETIDLRVERKNNGFLKVELPPTVLSKGTTCYRAAYRSPQDPPGKMHIFTVPPTDFIIETSLMGGEPFMEIIFQKIGNDWYGTNNRPGMDPIPNPTLMVYTPNDVEYRALELLLASSR